jgi:erythromycin esterase
MANANKNLLILGALGPIVFAIVCACADHGGAPPIPNELADHLKRRSIPIRSISPTDQDFSDLEPLAKYIGDRRITELDHYAAATFDARSRLAKFLYQRLGFDVISFEHSFFEMERLDRSLDSAASLERFFEQHDDDVHKRILAAHRPLFDFVVTTRTRGERPIRVMGESTYYATDRQLATEIEELFQRTNLMPLTTKQWTEFRAAFKSITIPSGGRFSEQQVAAAREAMPKVEKLSQQLGAFIKENRAHLERTLGRDRTIWLDYLIDSFPAFASSMTMGSVIDPARSGKEIEQRDRAWAKLLIRSAEERFPQHKFIVFAAPAHLLRRPDIYPSLKSGGITNMGLVLDQRFGKQIYTIHVAVYGGVSGSGAQIPPAEPDTIAGLLHQAGNPARFLDLGSLPSDHWMRQQSSRLGSGAENHILTIWPEVVDGILYIERERPMSKSSRLKDSGSSDVHN